MDIIKLEKQTIIDTNRRIVEEWLLDHPNSPDEFGVRQNELDTVLEIIDNVGNEKNFLNNLIIKAAYIMAVFSWDQPFTAANKRTGVLVAATFLHDHGYDLNIRSEDQHLLRKSLYDIQLSRSELDSKIISDLILYICRGISKNNN